MCTVTVDRSPKSQCHTCFSSSSRENTVSVWVEEEHQQVELAVGQADRAAPAMVTERAAVATRNWPAASSVHGTAARRRPLLRRSTERTRSASSRGLNGLVR